MTQMTVEDYSKIYSEIQTNLYRIKDKDLSMGEKTIKLKVNDDITLNCSSGQSYYEAYDLFVFELKQKEMAINPSFEVKNPFEIIKRLTDLKDINLNQVKAVELNNFFNAFMGIVADCKYVQFSEKERKLFNSLLKQKVGSKSGIGLVSDIQIKHFLKKNEGNKEHQVPINILKRTLYPKTISDEYSLIDGQSSKQAENYLAQKTEKAQKQTTKDRTII